MRKLALALLLILVGATLGVANASAILLRSGRLVLQRLLL
jgi:hypothetical protein